MTGNQVLLVARFLLDLADQSDFDNFMRRSLSYQPTVEEVDQDQPVLDYGLCVGSDDQTSEVATWFGYRLIAHPASDVSPDLIATPFHGATVLQAKPALERNRDIVDASGVLVAAPREQLDGEWHKRKPMGVLRSGTWATVRYAVEAGKPVWFAWPDGTFEKYGVAPDTVRG